MLVFYFLTLLDISTPKMAKCPIVPNELIRSTSAAYTAVITVRENTKALNRTNPRLFLTACYKNYFLVISAK
jgi:hypothetical protein